MAKHETDDKGIKDKWEWSCNLMFPYMARDLRLGHMKISGQALQQLLQLKGTAADSKKIHDFCSVLESC